MLENLRTREAAATVAQKIVGQISAPAFQVDGRTLEVTTSIGIAFLQATDISISAEELLARADAALYDAKSAGRNRFAFAL